MNRSAEWGAFEWGDGIWGTAAGVDSASGSLDLDGSATATVAISAVAQGLLELNNTAEGSVPVFGVADGSLELTGAAIGSIPVHIVVDIPVEWGGSFDLVLTWDTIQRLLDELNFKWLEVAQSPIFNNILEFSWNEMDNLVPLVFSWTELPANLLAAYELDPQKPYGRVSKP